MAFKDKGGALRDYGKGEKRGPDAILDVSCDIWIPAARPDVVRADNVGRLKTRLMPQGANIPCTPEAEEALHRRGVLVVPDFIANAGGVICAAMEYAGSTEGAAMAAIATIIVASHERTAKVRTVSAAPAIVVICAVGAYTINNAMFDVWMMALFGVVGYVFNKLKYPLPPLVLALVLGDMAESSFRQSMLLSQGDLSIFWSNGLVGVIFGLGVILLFWPLVSWAMSMVRQARPA